MKAFLWIWLKYFAQAVGIGVVVALLFSGALLLFIKIGMFLGLLVLAGIWAVLWVTGSALGEYLDLEEGP